MSNVRFELNKAGVRELLQSTEVQNEVERRAKKVLNALPEGYEMDTRLTGQRAVATVFPVTEKTKTQAKKDNTLLKALNAARGN